MSCTRHNPAPVSRIANKASGDVMRCNRDAAAARPPSRQQFVSSIAARSAIRGTPTHCQTPRSSLTRGRVLLRTSRGCPRADVQAQLRSRPEGFEIIVNGVVRTFRGGTSGKRRMMRLSQFHRDRSRIPILSGNWFNLLGNWFKRRVSSTNGHIKLSFRSPSREG